MSIQSTFRLNSSPTAIAACVDLAAGLLVTAVVAALLLYEARDQRSRTLESAINQAALRAQDNFVILTQHAHALAITLAGEPIFDQQAFRSFSEPMLELQERAGTLGLIAVEWAPRITHEALPGFAPPTQPPGARPFGVMERDTDARLVPAGHRADYFPIVYQIPTLGAPQMIGFDHGAEAARREAMDRAARLGQVAASPRIRLVRRTDTWGIALVAPVFVQGTFSTASAHADALRGFIFVVTSLDRIARHLRDSGLALPGLHIYDITTPGAPDLLYPMASERSLPTDLPEWAELSSLRIADRDWLLALDAAPPAWWQVPSVLVLLIAGIGLSALLTTLRHNSRRLLSSLSREIESHVDTAAALRALSARLERAREDERLRISRELHDELGQLLTAAKIDLKVIERDAGAIDPSLRPRLLERIASATSLVDRAMSESRQLARSLRPEALDHLGLAESFEAELERFAKRTGLEVATDIDEVDVERELKLALFRSLQELLTNIARHAKATSVEVKLQQKDGRITLSLRDDGIGFYPDERRKSSLGLVGITERIMAHDGTMDIVSRPGFGTFVKIEVAARDDAMERALEAAKQSAD